VLLGVEQSPAGLERLRNLRTEQAVDGGIAVGEMPARDLVVAFVVKRSGEAGSTDDRIQSCGRIAAFGENADRLRAVRIVGFQIEQPCGIQRVSLPVQCVARVFDENDVVGVPEGTVVEACVGGVGRVVNQ
jgi:hypothetical protein